MNEVTNQVKTPAAIKEVFKNCKLEWGDPTQISAIKLHNEYCTINDLLDQLKSLTVYRYYYECPLCDRTESSIDQTLV